jgi:hypothetical protein
VRGLLAARGVSCYAAGCARLAALPSQPPPHAELAARARGVTGAERNLDAIAGSGHRSGHPNAGARSTRVSHSARRDHTGFGRRAASGARQSRGGKDDQ